MKSILLNDIQDILIGRESDKKEEEEDEKEADDDDDNKSSDSSCSRILKIITTYHTIKFIYSIYPPDSRTEQWIQSLLSILHYLSIPVIFFLLFLFFFELENILFSY